ncbi:MAG TPA: FliH/SctL family protein [Tissierellaceae bacterium]|nr:FliH/SctL family protein [Tissierellaceae bacterium]
MESSYRIIKNRNIANDKKAVSVINTKAVESYKKQETKPQKPEKAEEIEKGPTEAEIRREIMMKIEEERISILKNAKEQADAVIAQAKKRGYSEGYETGYREGLEEVRKEAAQIKEQALGLIRQAEEDVASYLEENRENIIRLSAQMAEAIIHQKIDSSDEDLLLLIKPILERYEANGNIVITCHPSRVETMKEKASQLQLADGDARFIVLSDENMEEYSCIIENQYQLIDLQIKKQLEAIVEEINKME